MDKQEGTNLGKNVMQKTKAAKPINLDKETTNLGSSKKMKKLDRSEGITAIKNITKEADFTKTQSIGYTEITKDITNTKSIIYDYIEALKEEIQRKIYIFFESLKKFLYYLIIYMGIALFSLKMQIMVLTSFSCAKITSIGVALILIVLGLVCNILYFKTQDNPSETDNCSIGAAIFSAYFLTLYVILFEIGFNEFTRLANISNK